MRSDPRPGREPQRCSSSSTTLDIMSPRRSRTRPEALGLQAIDLFSGAGGLTQGFRAAGFDVTLALDNDPESCETYLLNHPDVDVACAPATALRAREILRRAGGHVDVVIGGPSCQGFSTAGRKFRPARGGFVRVGDDRNKLWEQMFKVVRTVQPRAFLMENVPGLQSFRSGQFGERVLREFTRLGYTMHTQVLLAADYGVPQLRRRVFIVGLRDAEFQFPEGEHLGGWRRDTLDLWEARRQELGRLPHVTCWEALSDLPRLDDGGVPIRGYPAEATSPYALMLRADSDKLRDHLRPPIGEKHLQLVRHVPPGGTWRDIPPHLLPDRFRGMRRTDSTNLIGRLDPNRPAYTITTQFHNVTTGCNTHPFEDRALSLREAARLQSFPDSYRFVGSFRSKARQVGNAVPPLLAEALALSLAETILERPMKRRTVIPTASMPAAAPTDLTRRRMQRQKRVDTAPEVTLRKALHARGLRYRVDVAPLAGLRRKADVVFRPVRVAVFVDGCFWHGCPDHAKPTKSNTKWWADKIAKNKRRDAETTLALEAAGWTVVRVWEHEDPDTAASRVENVVRSQARDLSADAL
ncbi:MAG: hypothetical protein CYG61_05455 [Actinobacteria bacterium]|nr:MAG: hypothetical protein CYG61_05455 [Actinomycetota bacterium]